MKSPQQKKTGAFYGLASGFYSLKTVQDQEVVVNCLRAFRNFKVSKSPEPTRMNNIYNQYGEEEEEDKSKEDKNAKSQKHLIQFYPMDYMDPYEENNKRAIENLGMKPEEFTREIHIRDFYNIKESKQMQMRRYFTKVQEVQQKIQAIIKERRRVAGEIQQKKREKNVLTAQIIKSPGRSGSPQRIKTRLGRGYGSDDDEENYNKKLKNYQRSLEREVKYTIKQFLKNEEKQTRYDYEKVSAIQLANEKHVQNIEETRNHVHLNNEKKVKQIEKFKEQEREIMLEQEIKDQELKQAELESLDEKEKEKQQKAKERYEKDQEVIQQRLNYQDGKHLREMKEYEESLQLHQEIEKRLENANKRQEIELQKKQSLGKMHKANVCDVRERKEEINKEMEKQIIQLTVQQEEKDRIYLEKMKQQQETDIKKIAKQREKQLRTTQSRFKDQLEKRTEEFQEKQQLWQSRLNSGQANRQKINEDISKQIGNKIREKQINSYLNVLEQQEKAEKKKDQTMLRLLEKKQKIDRGAQEYSLYLKKKIQLKMNQKKKIEDFHNTFNSQKQPNQEIQQLKYEIQENGNGKNNVKENINVGNAISNVNSHINDDDNISIQKKANPLSSQYQQKED